MIRKERGGQNYSHLCKTKVDFKKYKYMYKYVVIFVIQRKQNFQSNETKLRDSVLDWMDVDCGSTSVTSFPNGESAWRVCNRKTAGQKGLDGARNSTWGVPGRRAEFFLTQFGKPQGTGRKCYSLGSPIFFLRALKMALDVLNFLSLQKHSHSFCPDATVLPDILRVMDVSLMLSGLYCLG